MGRMMLATLVLLAMPTSAVAQTTALDCVPPAPPLMGYDEAMLQEYRDEIGLEYLDYFTPGAGICAVSRTPRRR